MAKLLNSRQSGIYAQSARAFLYNNLIEIYSWSDSSDGITSDPVVILPIKVFLAILKAYQNEFLRYETHIGNGSLPIPGHPYYPNPSSSPHPEGNYRGEFTNIGWDYTIYVEIQIKEGLLHKVLLRGELLCEPPELACWIEDALIGTPSTANEYELTRRVEVVQQRPEALVPLPFPWDVALAIRSALVVPQDRANSC